MKKTAYIRNKPNFVNLNLAKHFIGESKPIMEELIKPLRIFGIKGLKQTRIYKDNSLINVTTFPEILDIYQNLKLWRVGCAGNFAEYNDGYFFFDNLDSAPVFDATAEHCKLGHGMIVIKKLYDYVDHFYFVADIDNPGIRNFFINNLDLIEKFLSYFYVAAEELLSNAEKHAYVLPDDRREAKQIITPNYNYTSNDVLNFNLHIDSIINKKNRIKSWPLTPRELEVISLISKGNSAKTVSHMLNISPKTVERHLENSKSKVKAKNTVELCLIVHNYGLFEEIVIAQVP